MWNGCVILTGARLEPCRCYREAVRGDALGRQNEIWECFVLWGLGRAEHRLHILSFHAVCGAASENVSVKRSDVWNINVKMIQGFLWLSRFTINMLKDPSGPDSKQTSALSKMKPPPNAFCDLFSMQSRCYQLVLPQDPYFTLGIKWQPNTVPVLFGAQQ